MPAGDHYSPTPLDFVLLQRLPDKGVLGGVHWAGVQVKHLLQQINDKAEVRVSNNEVQGRLRSMAVEGLVENFAGRGGRIWARTEKGKAFMSQLEVLLNG